MKTLGKRYTIAEKKGYLNRFHDFKGTQKAFCVQEGIRESVFCKWKGKSEKIQRRSNAMKGLHRGSLYENPGKLKVLEWAKMKTGVGVHINACALVTYMKKSMPKLLKNANSDNARHRYACRLLLEMRPELDAYELEVVSTSLVKLGVRRGLHDLRDLAANGNSVSSAYTHGAKNRFENGDRFDASWR